MSVFTHVAVVWPNLHSLQDNDTYAAKHKRPKKVLKCMQLLVNETKCVQEEVSNNCTEHP